MKKLFTFIAIFTVVLNNNLQAQVTKNTDIFLGPAAGFGDSWVSNMGGSHGFMPSGFGGVNCIDFIDTHFAFGGQLLVSAAGYNVNYYGQERKIRPEYFQLPLRAYYFFGDHTSRVRPDIFFGPSFGYKFAEYNMATNVQFKDVIMPENKSDIFRNFDAGLEGGAGIAISLTERTSLNIDLEYYQGLTDVVSDNESSDDNNDNRDVDLTVSLLVRIR